MATALGFGGAALAGASLWFTGAVGWLLLIAGVLIAFGAFEIETKY